MICSLRMRRYVHTLSDSAWFWNRVAPLADLVPEENEHAQSLPVNMQDGYGFEVVDICRCCCSIVIGGI